jgi:hypothetical protein
MKADRLTETARMQHAASHSRLRCGLRVGRGKRVDDLEPPVAERPPASLTLPPFDGAFFFESRLNRAAHVIIEL